MKFDGEGGIIKIESDTFSKKEYVKDVIWSSLGGYFLGIRGIVTSVLFLIEGAHFGAGQRLFNILISFMWSLIHVISSGMGPILLKYLEADDKKKVEKVVTTSLAYCVIGYIVLFFSFIVISNFVFKLLGYSRGSIEATKEILKIYSPGIILFFLSNFFIVILNAEGMFAYSSILYIVVSFYELVFYNGFFLIWGVTGYAYGLIITEILFVITCILVYIPRKDKKVNFKWWMFNPLNIDVGIVKDMFLLSSNRIFGSFIGLATSWISNLTMNIVGGDLLISALSIVDDIFSLAPNMYKGAVNMKKFSEYKVKKDEEKIKEVYVFGLWLPWVWDVICLFFLYIFQDVLVSFFLGLNPEYEPYLDFINSLYMINIFGGIIPTLYSNSLVLVFKKWKFNIILMILGKVQVLLNLMWALMGFDYFSIVAFGGVWGHIVTGFDFFLFYSLYKNLKKEIDKDD